MEEMGHGGVEWFHLGCGRGQWHSVMSTVMNLQVSYKVINHLNCRLLASWRDPPP
jgi:hypothetical protein